MKRVKSLLALVLALLLILAVAGCSGKDDPANSSPSPDASAPTDSAQPSPDDSDPGEWESYTIGFTNLCSGIWSIDYGQQNLENYVEPHGIEVMSMSANFSADQMMKDVQNMVQADVRGITIIPVMPTMLPSVSELCEEKGVYFAGFSQLILGDTLEMMKANPYFCGSVGMNAYEAGRIIGELALEDGKTAAVIVAGAIGNTNHDNLIAGFTEVFEAGGGKVMDVGHSETDSLQRADDLIATYGSEIDCAFGMGMDFADSLLRACTNYGYVPGKDIKVYAAELDSTAVQRVLDGEMGGLSQQCIDSAFSGALVMNAIDGKRLLDENGDPVWADGMRLFKITEDNAENYQKFFIDGFPLPQESYDTLLYRCNPDVSAESFIDYLNNYTYEFVMGLRGE